MKIRSREARRIACSAALGLAALAGCDHGAPVAPPGEGPAIQASRVSPGPHNVLSAVVRAIMAHADSARVRFGREGEPFASVTPAVVAIPDTVVLPVLGLEPETGYRLQVEAYGAAGSTAGDTLDFTTGPVPGDLPRYVAGGPAPAPGYVVFGAYPYGVVIDSTGRVVWYRRLDQGPTLNFQVEPGGLYATSPITVTPGDPTPWVLYDPLGNAVRRLGCAEGLVTRFHELRLEPDGSAWLLCDETRTLDLTGIGGQAAAQVTATVVQHLDQAGAVRFQWHAFDHFALTELDSISRTGPDVNFTHGNALDIDSSGHLLVSFRSLNEITSIDTTSGQVLWRLGGLANQFTLAGGATPFVGQHGLRVIGRDQIQFLDNRGIPGDSRALRWVLDETALTARLVGSFGSLPPVEAQLGGSTQLLRDGRLLVAYGNGHRVQEYDATGNLIWAIDGDPGYVFRATRITSLYSLGVELGR
jgi:hypothetical protein